MTRVLSGAGEAAAPAASSFQAREVFDLFWPQVEVIAASAASRSRAIGAHLLRGTLLRASEGCHCPPR
ncbi:hypothetical protein [Sorangium sp. So ce394]|uniref:hypothetical protein n=1 Tax=Sorangium sp. So ce394 TaxID=3133310 RepID=UPI003F5C0DF9